MKKSFLKRVMAAAVAVPVALTQTAMFASFAAGEETTAEGDIIDKGTFLNIECDPTVNKPATGEYKAPEASNEDAIVQENNWNSDLRAALNAMYDEQIVLDPAKLADDVSSTAWYSEFFKGAVRAEGTKVTAKIQDTEVVITIAVDYNYGNDAAKRMARGNGAAVENAIATYMNSKAIVRGTIVITADTTDLDTSKEIPVSVEVNLDGMEKGDITKTFIPYVQKMWDTTHAEMREALAKGGVSPDALEYQVKTMQGKINTAQRAINRAGETYNYNYTAANAEELWEKARENAVDESPRFGRIPLSIATGQDTNAYACASEIFTQVIDKINEKCEMKKNNYHLNISLDGVVDTVNTVTNITAHADASNYNYNADAWGYLPDEEFEKDVYMAYFTDQLAAENEELAKEGKEKVVVDVESVKVAEVAGTEKTADLTGTAYLNVYRVTWPEYEIKEIKETDATEDTQATDATEDTQATDATEDTQATDATEDTQATDATEDTQATDATEDTQATDATEDTQATDATEDTQATDATDETDETGPQVRPDVKVSVHGGFYFSHDPRAFSTQNLVDSATIIVDGEEQEADLSKFEFSFRRNTLLSDAEPSGEKVSPQSAYADQSLNPLGGYFGQTLYVYYEGQLVDAEATVYIGVKGDVNNDGVANASDAAKVLIYAAEVGATGKDGYIYSQDNENFEKLAYFLGDTNGESIDHGKTASYAAEESPLNASDAAQILIYTAAVNASDDGKADWIPTVLKSAPYPTYSEAIAKAAGLMPAQD
ncbi:MAG: hypothetical protein K5695_05125 [Oscillospiraceae bacterium]|nr:hypothetical protein [Oscillospiraceae bacterium]